MSDHQFAATGEREKRAPVQGYAAGIPWSIHMEAYDAYSKKWRPQPALIEGGCRGGFHVDELDDLIPGWRDRVSEIGQLKAEVARLRASLGGDVSPAPSAGEWLDKADVLIETLVYAVLARDGSGNAARKLLRAHLGKRPVAAEWQPIETAPKGPNILLSDGTYVSEGGWVTDMDQGAEWEGQIGMAGWWHVHGDEYSPTHWMPLPPAPVADKEGAQA